MISLTLKLSVRNFYKSLRIKIVYQELFLWDNYIWHLTKFLFKFDLKVFTDESPYIYRSRGKNLILVWIIKKPPNQIIITVVARRITGIPPVQLHCFSIGYSSENLIVAWISLDSGLVRVKLHIQTFTEFPENIKHLTTVTNNC